MSTDATAFPAFPPAVQLFGLPISTATLNQVLDRVHEAIINRRHLQIGVVNAAKIVKMKRNNLLWEDVMSSDIILADGNSIVWASHLLGAPLLERVAGIDLMMGMFLRGSMMSYRFFLIGATESVSLTVAARIRKDYPGALIVGRRNGFFSADAEAGIAREIMAAKPDILLIAMSSPKKERFLSRWSKRVEVPVCHGVGGSFDVLGGKVLRAPLAWQRLGLEWCYRLKQEPRRLLKRYLLTNTLFILMTLKEIGRRLNYIQRAKSS